MLKMELFLYHDNTSLFLRLFSNYINAEKKNIVSILNVKESTKKLLNLPEAPFLVTVKNEIIADEIVISQLIANFAGRSQELFGAELDIVDLNLNFIKNSKKKSDQPAALLQDLNSHLVYNTFINGFHITVSDIYAYALIIKYLCSLAEVEKNKYTNILRWVNHLQNLEMLRESIKEQKLNISIPFEPLVFVKEEAVKCNLKNAKAEKAAAAKEAKKVEQLAKKEGKAEDKPAATAEGSKKSENQKVDTVPAAPAQAKKEEKGN